MARKRKASESALKKMMDSYGYFTHKWRDRGYVSCPNCHRQITSCPICRGDMLLQKAQTYPDFLVAKEYAFVECKQAHNNFNLYDLTPRQEGVLTNATKSGWVFIELGDDPGPKRQAYLVEWRAYVGLRQYVKDELGFKSVARFKTMRGRTPLAENIFEGWELEWVTNVGWTIPDDHEWWSWFPKEDNDDLQMAVQDNSS